MNEPRSRTSGPVLWLVIGIPLLTVIGGFWTLWLAMQSGASDPVPADVRRTAQVQDQDLNEDVTAARLGLRFELAVDGEHQRLRLTQVAGSASERAPLRLAFVHPSRADADRRMALTPDGQDWQARLPILSGNDWHLVLSDGQGRWRLVGTWPRDARQATLVPALRQ